MEAPFLDTKIQQLVVASTAVLAIKSKQSILSLSFCDIILKQLIQISRIAFIL